MSEQAITRDTPQLRKSRRFYHIEARVTEILRHQYLESIANGGTVEEDTDGEVLDISEGMAYYTFEHLGRSHRASFLDNDNDNDNDNENDNDSNSSNGPHHGCH